MGTAQVLAIMLSLVMFGLAIYSSFQAYDYLEAWTRYRNYRGRKYYGRVTVAFVLVSCVSWALFVIMLEHSTSYVWY